MTDNQWEFKPLHCNCCGDYIRDTAINRGDYYNKYGDEHKYKDLDCLPFLRKRLDLIEERLRRIHD